MLNLLKWFGIHLEVVNWRPDQGRSTLETAPQKASNVPQT